MQLQITSPGATEPVSKVKIALGAASLFLFIVGVKRSYNGTDVTEPAPEGEATPSRRKPRRNNVPTAEAE
jgi:hypothetical protein